LRQVFLNPVANQAYKIRDHFIRLVEQTSIMTTHFIYSHREVIRVILTHSVPTLFADKEPSGDSSEFRLSPLRSSAPFVRLAGPHTLRS